MSDQDRILAHLKSYQDDMVLLEVFTNTDSRALTNHSWTPLLNLWPAEWEGLDAKVTILEQDTYGNHVKVEVGSGDETILLYATWIPCGMQEKHKRGRSGWKTVKPTAQASMT